MIGLASASAILLMVSVLGLFSNSIALLTVYQGWDFLYLRNTFGDLCVSLAFSNLGVDFVFFLWCSVSTFAFVDSTYDVYESGMGKRIGQIALLFLYGSAYTHLAVSFNRMLSIVFPLRYFMMFKQRKSTALLVVVWLCAFIEIVPYFWNDQCYFIYEYEVAMWTFAKTQCGEFFGFYFDFLPSISIVVMMSIMDLIALIQLSKAQKTGKQLSMTGEQIRTRKLEISFFIQSLCQSIPFLIAILCFHVVSRYADSDWSRFFCMTFSWVSLHTIDGMIIDFFHTRQSVFKLPKTRFHISRISSTRETNSNSTRPT